MKPVFPNETRRERALRAARLHIHHATELSSEAVRAVCEELLDMEETRRAADLAHIDFETVCTSPGIWKTYAEINGERVNGWASERGPEHSLRRAVEGLTNPDQPEEPK